MVGRCWAPDQHAPRFEQVSNPRAAGPCGYSGYPRYAWPPLCCWVPPSPVVLGPSILRGSYPERPAPTCCLEPRGLPPFPPGLLGLPCVVLYRNLRAGVVSSYKRCVSSCKRAWWAVANGCGEQLQTGVVISCKRAWCAVANGRGEQGDTLTVAWGSAHQKASSPLDRLHVGKQSAETGPAGPSTG